MNFTVPPGKSTVPPGKTTEPPESPPTKKRRLGLRSKKIISRRSRNSSSHNQPLSQCTK